MSEENKEPPHVKGLRTRVKNLSIENKALKTTIKSTSFKEIDKLKREKVKLECKVEKLSHS